MGFPLRPAPAWLAWASFLLLTACGAKTPLEGRDAATPAMDAGLDAGTDAGLDAGTDAGLDASFCVPGNVSLLRSQVEVVFVVDRSGSMRATFEGLPPIGSEQSRWELLAQSMANALSVFDDSVSVGGKFFPSRSGRSGTEPCEVFDGLDVPIGTGRSAAVVSQFPRWRPAGGTPVGPAVREALEALIARTDENTAQFIIVATDGAPSRGDDPVTEALTAIREAHAEQAVDVFVVGIASTEPEVALLDEMAIEGGRARPPTEDSRFYDARDPELLGSLLGEITEDLTQCVFAVPFPPGDEDTVEVQIAGSTVARDPTRVGGWDWTSERRGQLSLFGTACDQAMDGAAVRAIITCGAP